MEGTNSRNCLLKFTGQCSIVENIYIIVCVPTNDSTCEKKNYSAKKKRKKNTWSNSATKYIYIYIYTWSKRYLNYGTEELCNILNFDAWGCIPEGLLPVHRLLLLIYINVVYPLLTQNIYIYILNLVTPLFFSFFKSSSKNLSFFCTIFLLN